MPNYMLDDDNMLSRVVNQNNQYEGGGITPLPQGGVRVKPINGLTVVRNTSVVGGAKLTLTWNDENIPNNDYFTIFIYAGFDWDTISTNQNPRDNPANQLNLYQAPLIAYASPAQIFIPATQTIQCIITVATRNSGGILSSPDFQSSVTATIVPLSWNVVNVPVGTTNISSTNLNPSLYLVNAASGSANFYLPLIAGGLPDGFTHTVKKNDGGANNIIVRGALSTETIDGVGSAGINSAGQVQRFTAYKLSAVWLKT